MSTLIIEGGHRLSGVVDVEGNKNAALPLMAATLLTAEPCVLTNVPRIADVDVMARLLLDLGAEVEGIGSPTLRIRCTRGHLARARPRAGRPSARLGAAARSLAGPHRAGVRGAAGRRLSGAPHDSHAHRGAHGDGRRTRRRRRASPGGAARPEAGVDLPRRGVGDRHRDGAARGGRCARHLGDSPRRLRAARRRAVRVPVADGRGHHGRWLAHHPRRGRHAPRQRHQGALRRLHRGRELGGGGGHHRRRRGDSRRARHRHGGGHGHAAQAVGALPAGGRRAHRGALAG